MATMEELRQRVRLTYGSLFSGIGGFDLGFDRAGMECRWQVEIDDKARAALDTHWPDVAKYKDVRDVGRNNLETVDVICGGFPCQDLSIAGKRAGLAGERSGLWTEFHRIIAELRPQFVVIENVPGLLSSNGGADFAVVLRGLVECGYGVAWRILDSQYFGVAQRRRRVFIVGSLGDGRAAEILFEREGCARDTPPSRETGQGIAGTHDGKSASSNRVAFGGNNTSGEIDTATAVNAAPTRRYDFESEMFVVYGIDSQSSNSWKSSNPHSGVHEDETIKTLDGSGPDFTKNQGGSAIVTIRERMGTGGNNVPMVGVRRLTPTECERLQGFPDGWTAGQSDSARYRQLGNAVTVNVLEWIGRRILEAK